MKEFKKTEKELFICEECGRTFVKKDGLSKHINLNHYGIKEYFDKWIKEIDDNKCKICEKETEFKGFYWGYKNCCSKECSNKYMHKQSKKGNLRLYGIENVFQLEKVKQKIKQTCLEKYGVSCPFKSKKIQEQIKQTCLKNYGVEYSLQSEEVREKGKQTCLEKYGNENYNNRKKYKETCLEKYDVENVFQSKEIQEQIKQTCLERYGVENPMQNEEAKEKSKQTCLERYGVEYSQQNIKIHEKTLKSAFELKRFRDTDIWYQGSYELDFLEKYLPIFPDSIRGMTIRYEFNGKNKVYYPDFYIPSLNLIVECKNSHLAKRDKEQIKAKKKATIANGFKYIIIVDKDYSEFTKYILSMKMMDL